MNVHLLRDKLVFWLSQSQAASRELTPEQHRVLCEKIGISEDLLREAHMQRVKRDYKRYRAVGRHGDYIARKISNQQLSGVRIAVHCSQKLKDFVVDYCNERRRVDPNDFCRSLVHHYLRGTWEPEHVTGKWALRGFDGDQSAVKEAVINTAITDAAKEALKLRAQSMGTSPTKLFRAILSAAVNEEFAQAGTIRFIGVGQMYSIIEKYEIPDLP